MPASPHAAPFECPVCGAEVPARALACPECGADERTGWNEEATLYDGLDLPDPNPPRDTGRRDEGRLAKLKPKGLAPFWWAMGIVMLLVFIYEAFRVGR